MNNKLNIIANWYQENNQLTSDLKRLKLLTFINAVLLDVNEEFTFDNKELVLELNPVKGELTNTELNTLKFINIALGYKENITNSTPFIKMFSIEGKTFTKNSNEIKIYFNEYYLNAIEKYKNYDLDCRIINYNGNTFYIMFDEELTDKDLETLKSVSDPEQIEFNVYKNNDELEIW